MLNINLDYIFDYIFIYMIYFDYRLYFSDFIFKYSTAITHVSFVLLIC